MIHIKNWIICILIGAFIVNIVDMVLPESKLKPYINLVCNFIFIFIVISPIVSFLSSGDSLEDKLLKSMNNYNEKYVETNKDLADGNNNFDLNKEYVIKEEDYLSKGINTPFTGEKVYGQTVLTMVDGQKVYQKEEK